jgi:Domain of unknown function (DUF4190)
MNSETVETNTTTIPTGESVTAEMNHTTIPMCDALAIMNEPAGKTSDVEMTRSTNPASTVETVAYVSEPKSSPMAIASMVCGIVGIFMFGMILGTLAIIFGAIALNNIREKPHEWKGKCQATAGVVCGICAVVIWLMIFTAVIASE